MNAPLCVCDTLVLLSSGDPDLNWSGPHGFSSTQQNANRTNIQLSDAGDYIIAVTKNGCTTKDTIDIVVTPILTVNPTISVNPGTTVCPTTDLTFSVLNPQTGATYTWTGPNGFTSKGATPTLNDSKKIESGDYKVVVTLHACPLGEGSGVGERSTVQYCKGLPVRVADGEIGPLSRLGNWPRFEGW